MSQTNWSDRLATGAAWCLLVVMVGALTAALVSSYTAKCRREAADDRVEEMVRKAAAEGRGLTEDEVMDVRNTLDAWKK